MPVASFPQRAYDLSAETIGGQIHVVGGHRTRAATRKFRVYDPLADTWTDLPSLPRKARQFRSAVVGTRMFVLTGKRERRDFLCFDTVAGTCSRLPRRPRRAEMPGISSHSGLVYVFGGTYRP